MYALSSATLSTMVKRRVAVGAVLFGSALVLSSCGDDAGNDVAEVTTTTAAAATTAAPDEGTESTTESTTTTQAPASSGGADNAEAAIRQFIEATSLGQKGRQWELVLPAQRSLLNRDAYFDCGTDRSIDVVGVEVIDQYPERWPVAGLGEQDSVALTLKVTVSMAGEEFPQTNTLHALSEGGRWYVPLKDEVFECAKA
jgi:hypothetical protein